MTIFIKCVECKQNFKTDVKDASRGICNDCLSRLPETKIKTLWTGISGYLEQCKKSEERNVKKYARK